MSEESVAPGACPVSVVLPTYCRPSRLAATLRKIENCRPRPAEIIVHIDAGDNETAELLGREFRHVRIMTSTTRMGPGGGRNKLVVVAEQDIVASFDDDSYPVDRDYFARLCEMFARCPDAAVLASQVTERGRPMPEAQKAVWQTVQFSGGGVAYRRSDFLSCGGYVSLAVAYGMEEVDLGLRLTDAGKKIYYSPWLRVFHDNDFAQHKTASVTASSIANQALLVYLRYPVAYWPYGALQVFNRIRWLAVAGRLDGIITGIARIPSHIWRHRRLRAPVRAIALANYLRARTAYSGA